MSVVTCCGVNVATLTLCTAAEICGVNCDTVAGAAIAAPPEPASLLALALCPDGAALGLAGGTGAPKLLRISCKIEGVWVALSTAGAEAMPASKIFDVTLSDVPVGSVGSTSTVVGVTVAGSTLGVAVLIGTDVVVAGGVGAMDVVGNILVPALGFTTLTCPANADWAALTHSIVGIMYLFIVLFPKP